MPTYVYRREDGTKFEIQQRITEDALEECPETGQPVERIIQGSAGLIFKGDGFYVNDYASSNRSRNGSNGSANENGNASEASPAESSNNASETASPKSND